MIFSNYAICSYYLIELSLFLLNYLCFMILLRYLCSYYLIELSLFLWYYWAISFIPGEAIIAPFPLLFYQLKLCFSLFSPCFTGWFYNQTLLTLYYQVTLTDEVEIWLSKLRDCVSKTIREMNINVIEDCIKGVPVEELALKVCTGLFLGPWCRIWA